MSVIRRIFPSLLLSIILLAPLSPTFAQKSRKQLEKEKKENLQKIRDAEKILGQTERKRANSLGRLNAINEQIRVRKDLIRAFKEEIAILDSEIEETNSIINSLDEDVRKLKKEYAQMVYATYKANQGYSKLTFVFSSHSFSQFLMRLEYMEQYGKERQNQAKEIELITDVLQDQIANIESKKTEKNSLLGDQLKENNNLAGLRNEQRNTIGALQNKEKELRDEVASIKKANEKLEEMISAVIKAEIAKNAKRTANNRITMTPEAAALSASFAKNHARLPWPVESGFISQKFGEQPHPVLKRLKVNNKGVIIQTNAQEDVRAVFDGKVSAIVNVPGKNNAVLVKHGEYFTLYANLKEVNVTKGQDLSTKQVIGKVYTNRDGVSELHFELWKNTKTLNPQSWLYRK